MNLRRVLGISSSSTHRMVMLLAIIYRSCHLDQLRRFSPRFLHRLHPDVRQHDLEASNISSGKRGTMKTYRSSVFLDDALTDPKPQTRPLRGFGCKERFKQMLRTFLVNSRACIADGDTDIGMPIRVPPTLKTIQP